MSTPDTQSTKPRICGFCQKPIPIKAYFCPCGHDERLLDPSIKARAAAAGMSTRAMKRASLLGDGR
jgi:hypothetical protein